MSTWIISALIGVGVTAFGGIIGLFGTIAAARQWRQTKEKECEDHWMATHNMEKSYREILDRLSRIEGYIKGQSSGHRDER